MCGYLLHGDVNDVIYDAEDASEGQYGCTRGPVWVHVRANMGSCEWAVMGLESRAVSALVIKNTQVNGMSKSRRVLAIRVKQRSFGLHMVCFEMVLYHNEPH